MVQATVQTGATYYMSVAAIGR